MSQWESDLTFRACLERVEWEIRRLTSRESEWNRANQQTRASQDSSSRADRAFTFIFLAGTLEDLFRELNQSLPRDLQHLELHRHDLRPTALSLLVPDAWDAISGDRVARIVRRRDLVATANEFHASTDVLELGAIKQLGVHDGRTVNVHHFEALWEGLCLAGPTASVWPSPQHRTAIVTLADKRNTIAHFETDPRDEAFRFTYGDLRLLAARVLESVERLHEYTIVWMDRHRKN